MKLLLAHHDGRPAEPWLRALRAALPASQVDDWQPGLPPEYDAALVWNPPQQLFDQQPQLKAAFNLGAGVDRLLALRLPPALQIVRLEDAGMAVQMAEYVCHALIRFFREFDRYALQQQAGPWQPRAARRRADYPVGVMGLGVIGARVARAVQAFDFPVHGWSRTPHALPGVRSHVGAAELGAFLAATRVLVCVLPLTDATRGILNRATLGRLQPAAYLINIARGALVVEDELRALLDDGHLAGAALDVVQQEPLAPGHWLWSQPGVTITPHISGMTLRDDTVAQLAAGVQALAQGLPPAGLVRRELGY